MSGQPDHAAGRGSLPGGWGRLAVPLVFACSVIGLLIEAAVPHLLPENAFTASVSSKTATCTSVASARVGRGCSIMDSSICVAVMTGLPAQFAACSNRRWMAGTCA